MAGLDRGFEEILNLNEQTPFVTDPYLHLIGQDCQTDGEGSGSCCFVSTVNVSLASVSTLSRDSLFSWFSGKNKLFNLKKKKVLSSLARSLIILSMIQVCPRHRYPGPPMCQLQHDHGALLSRLQDPGRLRG